VLLAVLLASLLPGQARGAVAPAFTLQLLDGKTTLRLADMKGSPIILLFWAPW
jgi:peroxiredoxin